MQSGSGYGAFNILTPTESLGNAAEADQRLTQSQLARATMPDQVATSALNLANAKTSSLAKTTMTDQQLIANAASLSSTPEQWDEAMQGLVSSGVPEAKQFVGRYSEQLKGRVANAYAASSPSSALADMQSDSPTGVGGATSGLASVAGGAGAGVSEGADPNSFDKLFAQATPQQIQASYQHLEKMRAAIDAVSKSANPAAEWDKQVGALGMQDQVGKYSPQVLQQAAQETIPLDNYLRGRLTRETMGVPGARIPAKVDNVGGVLYAVDESDPAHPTAKALSPQGKSVLVGVNPDSGVGVYYDSTTGKETQGSIKLGAKPGVGGRGGGNSVFALKQAAWLQAHPGDTQGALDYAGSLKGKSLSPQQIQLAATSQAGRELADMSLAGTPPPDPQGFITTRTQEIAEDISARGNTPTGAPAASPGSIPTRALAQLKGGQPVTFQNGQTWQMVGGKPKRLK